MIGLSCTVIGCTPVTTDDEQDPDLKHPSDPQLVVPKEGDWTVVTTGWANGECNAEASLLPPRSLCISDVTSPPFRVTYFDDNGQVGTTTACSHTSDDTFGCKGFKNGLSFTDVDDAIEVTSNDATSTIPSETSVSGSGNFVFACTGADCGVAASRRNSPTRVRSRATRR